ncbi:hypothetical protein CLAFUW4_11023 [Fulvia fulva]|uniref:Uncharacterized protein n=1 Tax=Passalora fulva TaxID=5499 RepID=A0A9Q8PBV0_PASFU|nr:uncharacterized protein CLAFUR5_10065 [Fulvia fulva]KAK4619623.1 hypothetical protein CLAFUR4_11028 [Fulvia fulva]KAK4620742.1 hypothetical protein CLAFUR0_11034 [Fulvia fulva]UJO19588.1 hypothetical protein CLAFUR5_10065 [Fulvia fulva]WPV17580.1 hypothetical protein CLAFUW4_11023 [Fulvia fulva]WPV32557.1 hypothetical protein CLAFUW7_11020 [Fulvia fulva]
MVFPFFELPREIRDAIYARTITDYKEISIPQTDDDTRTYTFDAPLPALLRCNRKLKKEYDESLPQKRRLLVRGADSDNWPGYPDINQHLARTIDECTVFIHNGCLCDSLTEDERAEQDLPPWPCDGVDFLATYKEALANFVPQFRRVRKVHLRIGIYGSDEVKHDVQDLHGLAPRLGHSAAFAILWVVWFWYTELSRISNCVDAEASRNTTRTVFTVFTRMMARLSRKWPTYMRPGSSPKAGKLDLL